MNEDNYIIRNFEMSAILLAWLIHKSMLDRKYSTQVQLEGTGFVYLFMIYFKN